MGIIITTNGNKLTLNERMVEPTNGYKITTNNLATGYYEMSLQMDTN